MKKYERGSSIELSPTAGQIQRLTKQCIRLGIKEPLEELVSNRREARDLMYQLRSQRRVK